MGKFYNYAPAAQASFLKTYKNWKDIDNLYGENCLEPENHYTFADDMVYYDSTDDLEKYIKRMLSRFANKNKQAYFEMILATLTMSWFFLFVGAEELSELCKKWYANLFFDEKYYTKYITEEEIAQFWRLR